MESWGGDVMYEHHVVVDRAMQRRAGRVSAGGLLVCGLLGLALLTVLLHVALSLPWLLALGGGLAGAPLSVAAVVVLRADDVRRRLPVGTRLVFRVLEGGVQLGPDGQERSRPWNEVRRVVLVRGSMLIECVHGEHLVIAADVAGPEGRSRLCDVVSGLDDEVRPVVVPADASGPPPEAAAGESSTRPPVRVDSALAESLAHDAAEVIVRPLRTAAIALVLLSPVAAIAAGRGAPVPYVVSAVFVGAVLVRWLAPAVVRRRVRARVLPSGVDAYEVRVAPTPGGFLLSTGGRGVGVGWAQFRRVLRHREAVVLVPRDGSPRMVLPVEAFPAALLAEGRHAVATACVA